jgi:hypothetical protein
VPDVRARIAWVMAGLTAVLVVADTLVSAQAVSLTSETAVAVHGFPFVHGAVLGSTVMGALIISRYDRHPIGWLLSLVGFAGGISILTEAYAFWVQEAHGPGSDSLGSVSAWVSSLLGGQFEIAGLALMFLLAPDGHYLSRRWRYVGRLTVLGAVLCLVAIATMDPTTFQLVTHEQTFGPARTVLLSIGFLLISGGLIASVVSVLVRLRASEGEQRQQLRLIALAAALPAAGIVWLITAQSVNGGAQTWAASLPLFIAYFLMPILFATAVLRYRLYDLDLIINRTVVVVAGTLFAGLGYTLLVVTVGRFVEGRTGGFWLSLLGTAVVALAFQPVRRGVLRVANRVAYGDRALPYEALADFSRDLARAPSPETLLPAVAEAAGRAVSARGVTATLDAPGTQPVTATWGEIDETPWQLVPVRNDGVDLGSIAVSLPRGRGLRPSDARLLQDLADQTAVAFRNTALSAQLSAHVAELDRATHDLAESRRRIIEAGDAARRTLEATITQEVLPHLVALPDDIRRERAAVRAGSPEPDITGLVDSTNTALESLRDITRGVFPTQLARSGIEPALRSLLGRSESAAQLLVDPSVAGQRFAPRVEAAVYFCCAEAVRTAPGVTVIEVALDGERLCQRVHGVSGLDLQGVEDRVDAVGGTLVLADDVLEVTIPVGPAAAPSALVGDRVGEGVVPGL